MYKVTAYLKTNNSYSFNADTSGEARDMAKRMVMEGLWVINSMNSETFYPITEIHKVEVVNNE